MVRSVSFALFALALALTTTLASQPPADKPADKKVDDKKVEKKKVDDKKIDKKRDEDLNDQVEKALKELEKLEKPAPDGPQNQPGGFDPVDPANILEFGIVALNSVSGRQRSGLGLPLPADRGIHVGQATANSFAAKGGIQAGDILVTIAGEPVPGNVARFRIFLDELKAADDERVVDVLVIREKKQETLKGVRLPRAGNPK